MNKEWKMYEELEQRNQRVKPSWKPIVSSMDAKRALVGLAHGHLS